MSFPEPPQSRPLLIYLHGFLSSPQSFKCRLLSDFLAENYPRIDFCAPHISPHSEAAAQSLINLVASHFNRNSRGSIGLVGSSMGGFWATYLAERYLLPAVVVNPAVQPARFMPGYIGRPLKPYSGEEKEYRLTQADVDTMRQLEAEVQRPLRSRYWLLAQRGDTTLDCRDAGKVLPGAAPNR